MSSFQISALAAEQFAPLFALSDDALAEIGAKLYIADANPGYPCRVSLQDAEIGDALLLLPFIHHETSSPYKASGPIFVRRGVVQAQPAVNEVPDSVRRRLLSARAYDAEGRLVSAEVAEGAGLEAIMETFFADGKVAFLHLHNARPGCYSCRVDRAE